MIEINGKKFNGSSINILNGKVIVDGKDVTSDCGNIINNTISVVLTGDLCSLTSDGDVEVNGDIVGKVEVNNNLTVFGNIDGNAKADNNLKCNDISGDAKAGNNIQCGNINGNVKAGNNIIKK